MSSAEPGKRLEQQITFLLQLDRLKGVLRRTYVPGLDRFENSAEHSWQLALAVILLAEHSTEAVDVSHAVAMALVHDIVEIEAGDTYVYDDAAAAEKQTRERAAAEHLFGMLPADQGAELRALWEELESGKTPEARLVAALDRVIPVLHNVSTAGRSWQEHGITAERVLRRNAVIELGAPRLWQLVRSRVAAAVAAGHLESSGSDE